MTNTQTQTAQTWTSGDADFPVVHLNDGAGVEVRVAPFAGFNAFSWRMRRGEETLHILSEAPETDDLSPGNFMYGYPLLFPFPNRVSQGRYSFEGETHQLDINWRDGNAIHGLIYNRPWNVIETGANDEKGAWVTASFDTRDFPDVMRQYPFECVVTATYALRRGELALTFEAQNVGNRNLPMGFGIHPWFSFPFTPKGERAQCRLHLPANAIWELESSTQLLPTKQILPVENTPLDFLQSRALSETFLDVVYTQLEFDGAWHHSQIEDPISRVVLDMKSSSAFREFVIYAPLDRDVICLEPYSGTTNAINLHRENVDTGLVILAPDQRWRSEIITSVTI